MILIRRADAVQTPAVPGVVLRPPAVEDAIPLGKLYFEAYDAGVAAATEQEALEDIELTFAGEYGVLAPNLSRLAWEDETLVGALLVVERAPWPDTPDCAFIIELFTARSHRRRGIARFLLACCAATTVALRVDDGNVPALELYRDLGFRDG
ncbi:ribosomal protein S18 acetylase RimI-like enzyme [Kribbella sp. VKM Ac-2569]|uniref:GNAT family N-acetyltransferase n=1 Tax=Kribbella sp. VKM Ac-2569 TaxID=2512220 RepID=UPI00102C09F1|nr:GNAT family N-acetyltransferase [Kribbella sp. VKM Ac-2569]RZT26993.1 ribosomal protein S18 acetylase RimI-like enzyme [Kribbella sp. VKM Ac-2569]